MVSKSEQMDLRHDYQIKTRGPAPREWGKGGVIPSFPFWCDSWLATLSNLEAVVNFA